MADFTVIGIWQHCTSNTCNVWTSCTSLDLQCRQLKRHSLYNVRFLMWLKYSRLDILSWDTVGGVKGLVCQLLVLYFRSLPCFLPCGNKHLVVTCTTSISQSPLRLSSEHASCFTFIFEREEKKQLKQLIQSNHVLLSGLPASVKKISQHYSQRDIPYLFYIILCSH